MYVCNNRGSASILHVQDVTSLGSGVLSCIGALPWQHNLLVSVSLIFVTVSEERNDKWIRYSASKSVILRGAARCLGLAGLRLFSRHKYFEEGTTRYLLSLPYLIYHSVTLVSTYHIADDTDDSS
jgi:hypothetical protein